MMSTGTPLAIEPSMEPPAAARAGADLRLARERLGLSVGEVASSVRIRPAHLAALEEGRISLLPGNTYALAFVRSYANALGLDAAGMVRRFKDEATEFTLRSELAPPTPMPERGLPAGALVLLGLVLSLGAYAGWYRLSGEGRLPAETVTMVPERLASLAEQALPRPSGPPVSSLPAPAQVAKADPAPPGLAADQEADTVSDREVNPAPPAVAFSPTSAAAAQLPRPADGTQFAGLGPRPAASEVTRVVLRANADSWLMVRDHAGTVLLNRTLKAGETWPVPARTDLLLTTGNAGGTDIAVDGAATPGLGANGAIRRDLPLDPDQIKNGKLSAPALPPVALARPRR
jgi:cytoskeleton protein RodZ